MSSLTLKLYLVLPMSTEVSFFSVRSYGKVYTEIPHRTRKELKFDKMLRHSTRIDYRYVYYHCKQIFVRLFKIGHFHFNWVERS